MVRQATPNDAPQLAKLIILAMGDLANKFINYTDPANAPILFERFARLTGNQYSYKNALVYEDETGVCGMILAYDGAGLNTLRMPFVNYIRAEYGFSGTPEDETQPGELYIDCLSVAENQQGKGIGKKLIIALIDRAAKMKQPVVGLLVSKGNARAKKLYTDFGFIPVGEKQLLGGFHDYMQKKITM